MRPKYKFIVLDVRGCKGIVELNDTIEEKSNELLTVYEEVDIQSMVKTGDCRATVIYKVKLYDEDELQDENWRYEDR